MKSILAGLLLVVTVARGEILSIRNAQLEARFDITSQRLTLLAQGQAVLTDGWLGDATGAAKVVEVHDKVFGVGQAIVLPEAQVALYPTLPFALLQTTVHHSGTEPQDIRSIKTFSAHADLGKPVDQLKTIGTGGLQDVEKNTGSYAWLALAEPQSRSGLVAGWLTHDRGSGVVFSPVTNGQVRLEAQIDYGRLRLKPSATEKLETFAVGWFADARLGLEAWADAIAKQYAIKLPPQQAGFCTWYTDKYSGACDEQHLAVLAEFAAKELKPFGFDFVQIDDHWQAGKSKNGPCRDFMNVKEKGPYPNGMQPTAAAIAKLGLTPGIWFMPFAGTPQDGIFLEHPEWFYHDKDGKPFEARWGGGCLDMSVPAVREYLAKLVTRLAHEWGYRLFKMDGLWTGTGTRLMYVNNGYKWDEMGEAVPADPNKTQIENYRDGLKLVREAAGPKVFLLGCCVSQNMRSFGGAFGLLDAMRIGPDTGAGHIGAPHASRNYFLNGRVWWNDPDCVSVRARASLGQARINASFTALTGNLFYNSDWIPDLPAERLDILKRTLAAHGLTARPADYFENDPARIWVLTDIRREPRRDVVALINWDQQKTATITCTAEKLGLTPAAEYAAFDFWANKFVAPFRGELRATLPPASCRVLAIRPASDRPQLISTSRHVTQGIVDVLEEKWDAATSTLSGVSRVIAGDSYELRISVPLGKKSWRAVAPAGVQQDGPRVRLTLTSATSADMPWQIKFEPARLELPLPVPVTELKATAEYASVTLTWEDSNADHYRIARDDGASFETSDVTFTDSTTLHGKKYRYTVTALGWGDAASAPATVETETPAELKRPPTPSAPQIALADLKPVTAKNGHGKLTANKSNEGKPLTVDGKKYERGMGAHANALFVYKIPTGAKRFVAIVGLDDEKQTDPRSSVTFEVQGDVQEMGEPPVTLAKSPVLSSKTVRAWAFDVELNARFKELRLVIGDAGDGIASDHADIVEAGFIK
jgi:hypothetical protein